MTLTTLRMTTFFLAGQMPATAVADTIGRTCDFHQTQHCTPVGPLTMKPASGGGSTVMITTGRRTDTSIDEDTFLKNLDTQQN